jgi:hypothetical protein
VSPSRDYFSNRGVIMPRLEMAYPSMTGAGDVSRRLPTSISDPSIRDRTGNDSLAAPILSGRMSQTGRLLTHVTLRTGHSVGICGTTV